jgi:hypothetical protein
MREFARDLMAEEAIAGGRARARAAEGRAALYFGITYPYVQRESAVVFLHEPWNGYFGRRDALLLWTNVASRELGLATGGRSPHTRSNGARKGCLLGQLAERAVNDPHELQKLLAAHPRVIAEEVSRHARGRELLAGLYEAQSDPRIRAYLDAVLALLGSE